MAAVPRSRDAVARAVTMTCRRGDGVPADASPGLDAIDATLHTNQLGDQYLTDCSRTGRDHAFIFRFPATYVVSRGGYKGEEIKMERPVDDETDRGDGRRRRCC